MPLPLCVRTDNWDEQSEAALLADGWRNVERLITWGGKVPERVWASAHEPFRVRNATEDEIDVCIEIGRDAFVHDRLHADPRVENEDATAAKAKWIADSFSAAHWPPACIAKTPEDEVAGFVIFKVDNARGVWSEIFGTLWIARIGLIGVAKKFRRQKVATQMLACGHPGDDVLIAGTQDGNIAAQDFYRSLGWRPIRIQFTFHKP